MAASGDSIDWKKIGLPPKLVRKNGTEVATATALAGSQYVGLFASASWCGYCQEFKPQLIKWYKAHAKALGLTLIDLPFDDDKETFQKEFATMAWDLSLKPKAKEIQEIFDAAGMSGMPTLAIYDASGDLVCPDARSGITDEMDIADFPWPALGEEGGEGVCEPEEGEGGDAGEGEGGDEEPEEEVEYENPIEVLARCAPFVDKAGKEYDEAYLRSLDYVALYFSAHWCPPCQEFTPVLGNWYKKHIAGGHGPLHSKVDIFYISSDNDEEEFNGYFKTMPWKAVKYNEFTDEKGALSAVSVHIRMNLPTYHDVKVPKRAMRLVQQFASQGIPMLIFLNKDGSVITRSARNRVTDDPEGWPWPRKPMTELAIAEYDCYPTLLVATDHCTNPTNEHAAMDALTHVAKDYFSTSPGEPKIIFAHAGKKDKGLEGLTDYGVMQFREDGKGPTRIWVILFDIPKYKVYLYPASKDSVPTAAELSKFVEDFLNKRLTATDFTIG